jgi:hypothetical protein
MSSSPRQFYTPLAPMIFTLQEYPELGFWIWTAVDAYAGDSSTDDEMLRAEGWERVDTIKPTLHYALLSQLAQELTFTSQEESEIWVRSSNLHFAQQYPVCLVHQCPRSVGVIDPKDVVIGAHALIFKDESAYLYDIKQLGQHAAQWLEELRQGVAPFRLRPTRKQTAHAVPMEHVQLQDHLHIELWERSQEAARQLAMLYWQYHQGTNTPAAARKIPEGPLVFQQGFSFVPASLAVQGVLTAYSNAQSGAAGWQPLEQKLTYVYKKAEDTAQVELRPTSTIVTADLTAESLWRQVRKFSDLDGDVLLSVLAQWIAAPHDEEGYVWVTTEQILTYRGIQPRMYRSSDGVRRPTGHRQEDFEAIDGSMKRIRDTHVTVRQWVKGERVPGKRGRPKKRALQLESYILSIPEFFQQQVLDTQEAGVAVAWRCRPGSCLEAFFDGPNRQIAWILQQALSYDPYHEIWEKRLARYFTFRLRLHPDGGIIRHTIGEMLTEVSLPLNRNDPEKTKRRFEKAMERLLQDHQISQWDYQEALADLPSKKWFDVWLTYHIQVIAQPLSPLKKGSDVPTGEEHS